MVRWRVVEMYRCQCRRGFLEGFGRGGVSVSGSESESYLLSDDLASASGSRNGVVDIVVVNRAEMRVRSTITMISGPPEEKKRKCQGTGEW